MGKSLVVFGASNILSDVFECAALLGLAPGRVVLHLAEPAGERSVPIATRAEMLSSLGATPAIEPFATFQPRPDEVYILGPTTPTRARLAEEIRDRFKIGFTSLVHPAASVSALARISPGCFVGAGTVIAPGVQLEEHVFVNRSTSIGHDTRISMFSRIQPGAHVASLTRIGRGVTIGMGACVLERLVVGDNAVVGAGSVVVRDLPRDVVAWGNPARIHRKVDNPVFEDGQ